MPEKLTDVWLRLSHADFVSDSTFGETAGRQSIDALRAGSGVLVMKKGVNVTGEVVDLNGQPVMDAVVFKGSDRFGSSFPQTKTNGDGQFEFAHSKPGEMVLTVVAKGFAPELTVAQIQPDMNAISISLQPGKTIRILAVDPDGEPLANVYIGPDTWRGHRSLPDADIPSRTNELGVYEWNDAPADTIEYAMVAEGFMDKRGERLTPRDEDYVIKFFGPLTVSGYVTDAETKQPIKAFSVVPGLKWLQGEQVSWERNSIEQGKDGKYQIAYNFPRTGHLLRIEAIGYEPVESRMMQSDEGQVTLDFELIKTPPLAGVVLLPSGDPASAAEVAIAVPNEYSHIFNGRFESRDRSQSPSNRLRMDRPMNRLTLAHWKSPSSQLEWVFWAFRLMSLDRSTGFLLASQK